MSALVTSSQGATGALQASQAGNQLLALQAQQLADLTAVVAAHGRAQNWNLPSMRPLQDQGREQLRRFLTQGAAINPQPCRCFTDEREKTETAPDRGSRGAHRPRSCRLRNPVT